MSAVRRFWQVTRWARAARFWALLLLAALAWLGIGVSEAHAQDQHATRQEAYTHCMAVGNEYKAVLVGIGYESPAVWCEHAQPANIYRSCVDADGGSVCTSWGTPQYHEWTTQCPPGSGEWNEELKRCFDPDECLQRNGAENGFPAIDSVRPFAQKCLDGCQFKPEGPHSCTSLSNGDTWCSGVFQFSGNTCSAPPPDPNEPPEPPPGDDGCSTLESGLTMCKDPNGNECVSAENGAKICWGTGETGSKSSGAEQATRGPGTDEPSGEPPTPPESFDPGKKKGPETATTTTTNSNGSTTTTTTTTVINGTTNGTTPPGVSVPPPPGSPGGGSGDDDEDENGASGGGSCEEPPVVTGDQALGMIATQAWQTRCAVEKASKADNVTGDVGDCTSPFSVEGTSANAQQLRAMRESICGPQGQATADMQAMKSEADALDGEIATMEGEFSSIFDDGEGGGEVPQINPDWISFGNGGCPALSITIPNVGTWEPPPAFCMTIAALAVLFQLIAALWGLQIIAE